MGASWPNHALLRLNFVRRVETGLWLDSLELKLVWILGLIEGKVLDDVQVKDVRAVGSPLAVFILIKYLPINLHTLNSRIFNVKSFAHGLALRYHSWNR